MNKQKHKDKNRKWSWWHMIFKRQRQGDLYVFEASLIYIFKF